MHDAFTTTNPAPQSAGGESYGLEASLGGGIPPARKPPSLGVGGLVRNQPGGAKLPSPRGGNDSFGLDAEVRHAPAPGRRTPAPAHTTADDADPVFQPLRLPVPASKPGGRNEGLNPNNDVPPSRLRPGKGPSPLSKPRVGGPALSPALKGGLQSDAGPLGDNFRRQPPMAMYPDDDLGPSLGGALRPLSAG